MKKFLKISLIMIIAAGLTGGVVAHAAGLVPCGNTAAGQPDCTLCYFLQMLQNIMTFLVNTSFIVVSLMVGIGGIMYMISAGKIDKAKATITSALWGFVIVMCSWLIINSMMVALGYNEANIGLKSVGNQFIINCEK